jgi:hypothetical protein
MKRIARCRRDGVIVIRRVRRWRLACAALLLLVLFVSVVIVSPATIVIVGSLALGVGVWQVFRHPNRRALLRDASCQVIPLRAARERLGACSSTRRP